MKEKSSLYKILIIFAGILLVITFFSRSIYQYNLPAVTLAFAEEGIIRRSTRIAGSIEAAEYTDIIAPESGKITLHIKEGESFEKGQLLYTIEPDTENLKDRTKTLENEKAIALVQINKLKDDIRYYRNKALLEPNTSDLDISSYESELERIRLKIQTAQAEKEQLAILYGAGAIPKTDLDKKEIEITELQSQMNTIKENRQKAIDKHKEEKIKDDKSLEQTQKDNSKTLTDLDYQLQKEQLSLKHIENEIAAINTQLEAGGLYEYYAPAGGAIASVYEAAKSGRYIVRNASVFSVQPEDIAYYAIFTISNDVDYIDIDSKCNLYIKSKSNKNIAQFCYQRRPVFYLCIRYRTAENCLRI